MSTNHSGRTQQRNGIAIGEGAIRKIFPAFVVVMWVTTFFLIKSDKWTVTNTAQIIAALILCGIVFVNFVYVFSYGYAMCLFAINLIILIRSGAPLGAIIIGGLLMIYAARLFVFVFRRYQSESFAPRKEGIKVANKQLPFLVKIALWIQTSTLMAFHAMTTFNVASKAEREGTNGVSGWLIIGALVLAQGLVIEARADTQKQTAKASSPNRWLESGLFSRSRHPNYLGEILVQLGVIIAGLGAASSGWAFLAGILAPTYIIILMISAATGGEAAKRQRYGDDPAFQAYLARSNRLLPKLR